MGIFAEYMYEELSLSDSAWDFVISTIYQELMSIWSCSMYGICTALELNDCYARDLLYTYLIGPTCGITLLISLPKIDYKQNSEFPCFPD